MKNKQANLSRRSVLGGSLAALTASPALAMTVTSGDDGALCAMGQEWQKAWTHLQSIYRASEAAEQRYHAMCPDFPATLTKTEQDWEFSLCVHPNVASDDTFQPEFIEQFRIKPRMKAVQHGLEPWPEAQARADEIVEAWDRYCADVMTAKEQSGFAQANKAECEAEQALHELEERTARTRVTSSASRWFSTFCT